MNYKLLSVSAVLLMALPAYALKVTNLDTVPHTVVLSAVGESEQHVIAAGATEQFTGATYGSLALADRPAAAAAKPGKKKSSRNVVQSDGVLSGYIGNESVDRIPTDPDNNYVIWPGGELHVQSRIKQPGGRL